MTARRLLAGLALVGTSSACAATAARSPLERLAPGDLAYAMAHRSYADSGASARADTLSRMLTAAYWELEGGDQSRGLRLWDAVVDTDLSAVDSARYHDLLAIELLHRRPPERSLRILESANARWPKWRDMWERRIALLQQSGKSLEARTLRARVDRMTF